MCTNTLRRRVRLACDFFFRVAIEAIRRSLFGICNVCTHIHSHEENFKIRQYTWTLASQTNQEPIRIFVNGLWEPIRTFRSQFGSCTKESTSIFLAPEMDFLIWTALFFEVCSASAVSVLRNSELFLLVNLKTTSSFRYSWNGKKERGRKNLLTIHCWFCIKN